MMTLLFYVAVISTLAAFVAAAADVWVAFTERGPRWPYDREDEEPWHDAAWEWAVEREEALRTRRERLDREVPRLRLRGPENATQGRTA